MIYNPEKSEDFLILYSAVLKEMAVGEVAPITKKAEVRNWISLN